MVIKHPATLSTDFVDKNKKLSFRTVMDAILLGALIVLPLFFMLEVTFR